MAIATRPPIVDPAERDRIKAKKEREEEVVKHVLHTHKFEQRPSKVTATHVFKNAYRVNVYAEDWGGEAGIVKSQKLIFSDLIRVDLPIRN